VIHDKSDKSVFNDEAAHYRTLQVIQSPISVSIMTHDLAVNANLLTDCSSVSKVSRCLCDRWLAWATQHFQLMPRSWIWEVVPSQYDAKTHTWNVTFTLLQTFQWV